MSWNPLRHLSPLSEHPAASPSLSPAISDTSLFFLESSIRLHKIKDAHYEAWKVINTFFEQLTHDGQINLASDILNSRDDDDKLVQLANHLLDAVLKPFLLAGGHTPQPLTPRSGDAPYAIDMAMSTIESSTRAEQTKLRDDCLVRDGYRCAYTGIWDAKSILAGTVQPPPRSQASYLECAHIIPFALGSFDDKDAVQTRNKAIIWFAMHRYFPEIGGLIDARSINQRGNALMLDHAVHRPFSECLLGFQPQGMNQYRAVQTVDINFGVQSKSGMDLVEFSCFDASIAMPEPAILQVHFAISQILQVSGFGRIIQRAVDETALIDHRGLDPSGGTDVGGLLSKLLLININAESKTGAGKNLDTDDRGLME